MYIYIYVCIFLCIYVYLYIPIGDGRTQALEGNIPISLGRKEARVIEEGGNYYKGRNTKDCEGRK
jgi:hypothetical protein